MAPPIPVLSGLIMALRAEHLADLGMADGAPLSTSWPDESAGANDGIAAGNPTFRTGQTPAGGACVRFDGGSHFGFTDNSIFDGGGAAEVFLVLKAADLSDHPGPFQFGGDDDWYPHSTGTFCGAFTHTRFSWDGGGQEVDWLVFNVSHDGTTWTARANGAVLSSTAVAFGPPTTHSRNTTLRVGGCPAIGDWAGDIAEVLAYNRALSSTERADTLAYLRRHITVALSVPAARFDLGVGAPTVLDVPAARFDARSAGTLRDTLAAPAARVGVRSAATVRQRLAAPPARLDLATPAAALRSLALGQPADGALVRSPRPAFTVTGMSVGVQLDQVRIEVDTDAGFSAPTVLTSAAPVVTPGLPNVWLRAPAALPDGVYHWRARLTSAPGGDGPYTAAREFTIDTAPSEWTVDGSWDVTGDEPAAGHLWFLTPAAGPVGTRVACYGIGFPAAARVYLGELALEPDSHDSVAATGDAAGRLIDPAAQPPGEQDRPAVVVTFAHETITFTVPPEASEPGGPLRIGG